MNRIKSKLCLAAATLFVICAANKATAAVEISLRERVVPHNSVVRLSDVAEITSGDRQAARQLATLPLMPAPARGTERYLRTREIQDMLAAQGVDVGELRFVGRDQVTVGASDGAECAVGTIKQTSAISKPTNRHAAILAGGTSDQPAKTAVLDESRTKELRDQLNGLVGSFVNSKTGKAGPWQVDCDAEPRQLAQLNTATSLPTCSGGSEPWTGRQRFLISFSTPDGQVQFPVLADVTPPPVPAVVAIRPIARGDVVRAADIELRTMDAPKPGGSRTSFDSVEKLIGMEARQSIQAGDVIMTDAVQAPILVKRGEMVTVTSQGNGIRVRTTAKALHDGAHGDLIQVESLGTKEKFDVRVVATHETEVFAVSPIDTNRPTRINTAQRTKPK
jgi:flagellar basal body P-ring formation protein FlgA